MNWQQLLQQTSSGQIKALARLITLVENEHKGYEELLPLLQAGAGAKTIGITGPPGAGKSTLVDALIAELLKKGRKVAVLCIDPSSPFNLGALLGDRVRMREWYNNPAVFIRSLATRGSLGGLSPKIIEILDLVKFAGFNQIIIETVGIGQSEVEIAGLADTTVVVLVPEAGDEIQSMKAGMMEIADVFVVNKADRPGADRFISYLHQALSPGLQDIGPAIPVVKTIASAKTGIAELAEKIRWHQEFAPDRWKKIQFLADKAYQLIQKSKMKDIDIWQLAKRIEAEQEAGNFNMYRFVESITGSH